MFGNINPEIEQTEAHLMARAAVESNESSGMLSSMEAALLWSWMMEVAIGVRYLWHPGPRN